MDPTALSLFGEMQTANTKEQYKNASTQFVEELKASNLFQHNWGELLGAAPTALSLMGACWVAAANETAERISLLDSMPKGGFKHMSTLPIPTLRACLVEVCNNGGRAAFNTAGKNMAALKETSERIDTHRIPMVFHRLGPCTRGDDEHEDFIDALDDFSEDAKLCAKYASEMHDAFSAWEAMVDELHIITENQGGVTALKAQDTRAKEKTAEGEKKSAEKAVGEIKKLVTQASHEVEKKQKHFDSMVDKVPGPWMSVLQTAVTSFAQALPSITAAAVTALNPMGAAAGAAVSNAAAASAKFQTQAPGPAPAPALPDPAYGMAAAIQGLVNLYYEYLGGEKATGIMWANFDETATASIDITTDGDSEDFPQGVAYLIGTLTGQKNNIDVTNTAPNKKLIGVYTALIELSQEIQAHLRKQNELSASKDPAENVVTRWRVTCRKARDDVLELTATAKSSASSSVPTLFGRVSIPPPDLSAQRAQLSSAMQGVDMAQAALDKAEEHYNLALEKQEAKVKQMDDIQIRLTRLNAEGKTLDEIKSVLRDCIHVLSDLTVQIDRLQRFFDMLAAVIEVSVMPRAKEFKRAMDKVGARALRSGVLRADDVTKQVIYTSTLELKAYFSLLKDIAVMYLDVHEKHIIHGVYLCEKMSAAMLANNGMSAEQKELADYTEGAAVTVKNLVADSQKAALQTLRARAARARSETDTILAEMDKLGVARVDDAAKRAIQAGIHRHHLEFSHTRMDVVVATDSEDIDANDA